MRFTTGAANARYNSIVLDEGILMVNSPNAISPFLVAAPQLVITRFRRALRVADKNSGNFFQGV
jgi:hypothetical protein